MSALLARVYLCRHMGGMTATDGYNCIWGSKGSKDSNSYLPQKTFWYFYVSRHYGDWRPWSPARHEMAAVASTVVAFFGIFHTGVVLALTILPAISVAIIIGRASAGMRSGRTITTRS